jgi:hypothetical protein
VITFCIQKRRRRARPQTGASPGRFLQVNRRDNFR